MVNRSGLNMKEDSDQFSRNRVRDICHSYNAFGRENIDNMTIGGR